MANAQKMPMSVPRMTSSLNAGNGKKVLDVHKPSAGKVEPVTVQRPVLVPCTGISKRCFICLSPQHLANMCPQRSGSQAYKSGQKPFVTMAATQQPKSRQTRRHRDRIALNLIRRLQSRHQRNADYIRKSSAEIADQLQKENEVTGLLEWCTSLLQSRQRLSLTTSAGPLGVFRDVSV